MYSVAGNRTKQDSRVDPTLRLRRRKRKRIIRNSDTHSGPEGTETHQSEEEVEIGMRLRGENDDVHYLLSTWASRENPSVSSRRSVLGHTGFIADVIPLTHMMAPTEQVSMTVITSRSITWSTDTNLKSATAPDQRIDRNRWRTLVTGLSLAKIV